VNIRDFKEKHLTDLKLLNTHTHTHIVLIYIFYNRWPRFDVLKLCL